MISYNHCNMQHLIVTIVQIVLIVDVCVCLTHVQIQNVYLH